MMLMTTCILLCIALNEKPWGDGVDIIYPVVVAMVIDLGGFVSGRVIIGGAYLIMMVADVISWSLKFNL